MIHTNLGVVALQVIHATGALSNSILLTLSNLRFELNLTHSVQSVHGVMASHIKEKAAKPVRNKAISTKINVLIV